MPLLRVTVAVPTLAADSTLLDCIRALERQTLPGLEVVVIDNSGRGLARRTLDGCAVRVIENDRNAGFGAAINQAWRESDSPFVASLNDDAAPHPQWLEALVAAMEADPKVGLCASQVRLMGENLLDSAGMLVCRDGSSKQRGHGRPPAEFSRREEALLPSGSAALYRRAMLEETGGFDEDFFLYCEDTDLGLRARWAGWKCLYVPEAVVEHRYSHSAGRVSPLKAYYVERNRLFVLMKNFPASWLPAAPLVSLARYGWHVASLFTGQGSAGRYRQAGNGGFSLAGFVLRAHLAVAARLPRLWSERRRIRRTARLTAAEFRALLREHSIGPREVAQS